MGRLGRFDASRTHRGLLGSRRCVFLGLCLLERSVIEVKYFVGEHNILISFDVTIKAG